ncbi:uncharacterized protein LOC122070797 [Macadamia integrifolia]|uniref:uncharacterized protein LOC122070797 n=1 Tax=Macadamia integrifolia TaxID=60698 RepID=UPI001C4EDE34|nr:uncharacterized protein LOC122070797 [Macadamia integrifolia]
MRKLCPNFDREDGLETVLEVPIPEEMFTCMSMGGNNNTTPTTTNNNALRWQNMRTWMKSQCADKLASAPALSGRNADLQFLLNVVGSPLIPLQVQHDSTIIHPIKDCSIEASTAKYIVQQYIAATGGLSALNAVHSMYAIGQVKMTSSEFHLSEGDESVKARGNAEIGGFVLWQKNPDLWYLELVVSGCKVSAGSDGKVAWRQYAAQQSHASKGPPRPLRRFVQGLDPRSTANLFSDAVCIGEKIINKEDCFILKLEASASTLRARNTNNFENIHHTIWGYFSQRTGLLIKFEDSHLLSMKKGRGDDSIFWETSMESVIEDYRYIDGLNIAHSGRTVVTLFRYGEGSTNHKRKMEETWTIEEVDFNICGLTMDSFLPPADLKRE